MAFVDTEFEEPERVQFAKLNNIGDSLEGIFFGTEERKNNFGKMEVHIRIKTGKADDGSAFIESLRANQRLLAQIASVRKGALVRIMYVDDQPNDGMDRDGQPLKPTKLYRVMVDDDKKAAGAQVKRSAKPAEPQGTHLPRQSDDDKIPF